MKDSLVSTGGIESGRINAVGKGSRPTSQLIACLQPDRRVEIEVTGTR